MQLECLSAHQVDDVRTDLSQNRRRPSTSWCVYRKEQGLTQDQLSEMAGYSRNHLQRVETAVCKPTVGLLLDVSEVLGVPVERLMEIRK